MDHPAHLEVVREIADFSESVERIYREEVLLPAPRSGVQKNRRSVMRREVYVEYEKKLR